MKKILGSVMLFCFLQTTSAQTSDKEILEKMNQDWLNAIANKDSLMLGKILAEDFIMVNPGGRKLTRGDNLAMVSSPDPYFTSIGIDSVNVTMLTPDVGIVSCWTRFKFNSDGKAMTGSNCYQDIYIRRKNKWQAVSAHVTRLSPK